MRNIELQIKQEDADQCGAYLDGQRCLLATALQREGHAVEGVGGTSVRLANGNRYKIESNFAEDVAEGEGYPHSLVGRKVELTFLNRWY